MIDALLGARGRKWLWPRLDRRGANCLMPAADAFRLLAAMAGEDDGEAALRGLVEATYEAIGWPGERAAADLEALRSVLIESPRDLRRALAAGHQYQVGEGEAALRQSRSANWFATQQLPLPILAIDALMARLAMPSEHRARFALTRDSRERLDRLIVEHRQLFAPHGILKADHLEMLTAKGWKKVALPVGLKVRVEAAVSSSPPLPPPNQSPGAAFACGYSLTSATRMVLQTDRGEQYEVDRYCPHKGADLLGVPVINSILECPRHRWKFDLSRGGVCVEGKNKCSLHARKLDW